ncbi:NAD synthetase [Pseudomonas putida]|uniref:NAD synthetase n=1 Tax=Pseudomonas putida TaxID=303 RepID=UPI00383B1E45
MPRPPITELGGNPFKPFARERIESSIDLPKLYAAIDRDPAIVGAGVVYVDTHYNAITLRAFQPVCSVLPKRLVLQELPRAVTAEQYLEQQVKDPRQSRLISDLWNTGLACTGFIGGLLLIVNGGVLTAITGGLGIAISIAGYGALLASAGQCAIGVRRVHLELHAPESNDELDNQTWFKIVAPLLDIISLLGIASASLNTIKYLQMRKRLTGAGWFSLSRTLSRQQRSSLMREILSIKHPSLTSKQLKLKQRLGTLPKRFTPAQIRKSTIAFISESILSGIGMIGNGMVQNLAVMLIEETSE